MPLEELAGGQVKCVRRACPTPDLAPVCSAGLVVVEWDAAVHASALFRGRAHVIVADPPYRREHVALLRRLADEGILLHLYYGQAEREATASILRYLVHPRFAMVCVYRAMADEAGKDEVLHRARQLGIREAGVFLDWQELLRAHVVLEELGLEQPGASEARIEAERIPEYATAEAEYEECAKLCRTI